MLVIEIEYECRFQLILFYLLHHLSSSPSLFVPLPPFSLLDGTLSPRWELPVYAALRWFLTVSEPGAVTAPSTHLKSSRQK